MVDRDRTWEATRFGVAVLAALLLAEVTGDLVGTNYAGAIAAGLVVFIALLVIPREIDRR